ncbi:hypothetical protein BJX96DRAFT_43790 [Aspergillus floccosus]
MSCSLTQSCFRQLARSPLRQGPLPVFLAPAFSQFPRTQPFSTTTPAQSRVGGATISIPPEVSLKFIDLPQTQVRTRSKEIPKTAIEVKGPLGELTLNIPPFVNVTHDEALRKASLTVEDSSVAHQRAMWGMFSRCFVRGICLTCIFFSY